MSLNFNVPLEARIFFDDTTTLGTDILSGMASVMAFPLPIDYHMLHKRAATEKLLEVDEEMGATPTRKHH